MMWWIVLLGAAAVLVPLALWYREDAAQRALQAARAKELALKHEQNQKLKEIVFRKQGESGLGNAAFGDIMCADGVYLPLLWESGFATSMDGRWLRISSYGHASPYLVDRKKRCTWTLSTEEVSVLEGMHWRLPRWSGEEGGSSSMHDDAQGPLSDVHFSAWLASNVANQAMPMVELRDLWVPWDAVPVQKDEPPPELPLPPAGGTLIGVQRYWPESLRTERQPLLLFTQPQWQLMLNGEPQPWVVAVQMPFVWREDGAALAMYAYPLGQSGRQQRLALAVWERERGWQKWAEQQPTDRKPWNLFPLAEASGRPAFRWMKDKLLQRVRVDTPMLQRMHQGSRIEYRTEPLLVPAMHQKDGRLVLREVPVTSLIWERSLLQPEQWLARSEPVAGKPLSWSLELTGMDTPSGRPGYRLRWGESSIPGLWELEHLIVRRHWAVLMRHPQDCIKEDGEKEHNTQLCVWDGNELTPLELPWPVERLLPVPSAASGQAARARLLAITAVVKDDDVDLQKPAWRWYQEACTPERLEKTGHSPLYAVRDILPDNQGVWRLLPSWRSIASVQHPCADGDYLWSKDVKDELWWWGGIRQYTPEQPQDDDSIPRCEGISVTRSGLVLCGTGPSAYPHPDGDGWLVLQCPERPAYGSVSTWSLHWLQPQKRQIRTLMLPAAMPLIDGWDNQGIYWREDMREPVPVEDGQPQVPVQRPPIQTVDSRLWQRAEVHDLKQGPYGLWLRKQDMMFADAIRKHPDWPWGRSSNS